MPRTATIPPDLSPDDLQKLSQDDWRYLEAKSRKVLKSLLSRTTGTNVNAKELADIMRSAAMAKDKAYPDSSTSGISVTLPAKLLKPIEQAILAQSKKYGGKKDTVKEERVDESIRSEANV